MRSYKEQFDKLTAAYIENRVEPYKPCACFVGNLLDGNSEWIYARSSRFFKVRKDSGRTWKHGDLDITVADALEAIKIYGNGYTPEEIFQLEKNFLVVINNNTSKSKQNTMWFHVKENHTNHENYENALFLAFDSTLDMLKKIHESRGEVVDKPEFKQRKLETA